jgi:abortive infection bacteriophage resistance protein
MPETSRTFDKKPLTPDEHIALLKRRGLVIADEKLARHYLKFIGYYRLSGYMLAFQRGDRTKDHHAFAPGTTFEAVLGTYTFDRKLRLLVMDAIERIEIGVKSVIMNEMCVPYGSHWYMNKDHFRTGFNFDAFMQTVQKDTDYGRGPDKVRNISLKHYYQEYDTPPMPPLWMVFEALTFGTVSLMFGWLPHADQKRIAGQIGIPVPVLKSWLHTTSTLRNLCAHHARIWSRVFTFKPLVMDAYREDFTPNTLFYSQAAMLHVLMRRISPHTRWAERLKSLCAEYPGIDRGKMGFPDVWENRKVWG